MSGDASEGHMTSAASIEYATNEGLDVKYPLSNQLFIDIDSQADYEEYHRNFDIVDSVFDIIGITETPSRRKVEGRHITLTLSKTVTHLERIALQAVLGSDRRREAHSIERLYRNDPHPTIFFERKPDGTAGEKISG